MSHDLWIGIVIGIPVGMLIINVINWWIRRRP